jgi:P-type E1-E2 ATPase
VFNYSFRFQNIVPISLYISVEFVRTCQAAFIYFDKDMWYEKTNQATLARTWNLSDDLGQIEYIFSDKTGTLTQVCFGSCNHRVSLNDRISFFVELYDL